MRLVRVDWFDAHHIAGEWVAPGDIHPGVACVTVGFLVRLTRRHLVVAATVNRCGGDLTGVFVIPRTAVRKLTTLKEKR